MKKVIWEILKLAWKLFRTYFWKWVRPFLGKMLFFGFIFAALVTVVVLLIAGSC